MRVRAVKDGDIARITEIYNWYILNTTVSFEVEAITPLEMAKRVQEKIQRHEWLVAESNGEIVGYTYYGAYHSRSAYSHTVESTIYLAQEHMGKGFGKPLYTTLIDSAKERGFREVIAVIALPNQGSIVLHEKLGFEVVGVLKKVGHKFGNYIDVGLWQKSVA